MAFRVRRVAYFYVTVNDEPGEAYRLLAQLARLGINLLAFTGVPTGPQRTQLSVFPEDNGRFAAAAKQANLAADGPHPALLVQGDDELGALVDIHLKLSESQINVSASSGVTDGRGGYGYVVYVAPQDFEKAARTLLP